MKKKIKNALYIVLAVVCPMCWKQLGVRFMQPVGKEAKGSYEIIKFKNGDRVVLEDMNELLSK